MICEHHMEKVKTVSETAIHSLIVAGSSNVPTETQKGVVIGRGPRTSYKEADFVFSQQVVHANVQGVDYDTVICDNLQMH